MKTVNHIRRGKRGSALVEYGLIVAGVALVGALAVSVFGSKVSDIMSTAGGVLPGMTAEDNTPLQKTSLLDTQVDGGVRKLNPTQDDNTLEGNFGVDGDEIIAGN